MKHVMTWALPNVDDLVWADFCRLASGVANCPAIPLVDVLGRPLAARDAFGGDLTFHPQSLPDEIELRSHDADAPFRIARGRCGSLCTNADIGYLAYGVLLVARFTMPAMGLHVMLSERDAGFGMVLAHDAIAAWLDQGTAERVERGLFKDLPGFAEAGRMRERAKEYEPLRQTVYRLLDAVGPGIPAGEFEKVTLATARAVLERLRLGVDGRFDAGYAVESLEGYFRQSVFVLPDPSRRAPLPEVADACSWEDGNELRRA